MQQIKHDGNNSDSCHSNSEDSTEEENDDDQITSDDDDDNVPGYVIHYSNEGIKIWILADRTHTSSDSTTYNAEDVRQLISQDNTSSCSLAPFHLTRADAIANVTRVRAATSNARSYEKCLKEQQVTAARLREVSQQGLVDGNYEGGEASVLSVAERKKLLWDSSGKLN